MTFFKFSHYDIRGTANELLRSYISNRSQFVQLGDTISKPPDVSRGVPQGTVFGHSSSLYVNDIFKINSESSTIIYADDITLL